MAQSSLRVLHLAERAEQFGQLIVATVNITDDVKRTAFTAAVAPERLAHDLRGIHCLQRVQRIDSPEPLALQATYAAPQRLNMIAHHLRAKLAVRAGGVALDADGFIEVQDNGDGVDIMLVRQTHQRRAVLRLDVGGVYHGDSA